MSSINNISAKFDSIASSSLKKMDSAIVQQNNSVEFGTRIENALESVADAQKSSNELFRKYYLILIIMDVIKELLSANYPFFYFFYGKFRGLLHHYISNQEISISKISDNIYIGDIWAAYNKEELKSRGITHIVNAILGVEPAYPDEFEYFPLSSDLILNSCIFLLQLQKVMTPLGLVQESSMTGPSPDISD